MEIIKNKTNLDFVSLFKFFGPLSAVITILAVVFAFTSMKYGVDFRGGLEIQLKFKAPIETSAVRDVLKEGNFTDILVQTIGEPADATYLLKLGKDTSGDLNKTAQNITNFFNSKFSNSGVEVQKIDIVGPKAGKELQLSAFLAMLWTILSIIIYVALRFDMRFAPGAAVSLLHDAFVVIFFYGITGTQFTLQTVGAILAVIGYSVNDTVVVYDRIRETEGKYPNNTLTQNINLAINETLSRTILTTSTVLVVCLSMLFFGGESIHDFFLAMFVGCLTGAYSTVYIAAPFTIFMEKFISKKETKTVIA
jgi:preprotein translocase subunit SecF